MKKKDYKGLILFCCIGLFVVYLKTMRSNILEKPHAFTKAKIYDVGKPSKINVISIDYAFKVEGKLIRSNTSLSYGGGRGYKKLFEKTFDVIYSIENPQVSYLLIDKSSFEFVGLVQPDSLNWVNKITGDK